MSVSPVANRSFLHGDRKPSPTSEKIIYATLDSLALKGATLPLQLLPIDDNSIDEEGMNESKRKEVDTTIKRSSFKMNTACLSSRQHAKYLLVVPPPKQEPLEIDENMQQFRKQSASPLQRIDRFIDNNDIDVYTTRQSQSTDNKLQSNIYDRTQSIELDSSNNEKETASPDSSSNDYEWIESFIAEAEQNKTFVKSKSTNDLAIKSFLDTRLPDGVPLAFSETLSEEKLGEQFFDNEHPSFAKKKKHFTRNVLHFVPEYLARGPKKNCRKKGSLSGSLSSLKTMPTDGKMNSNARWSRSRSLSRGEISSPTNFVHVASATNPRLVSSENTARFNLEQLVITHEQKCATVPLLVAVDNSSTSSRSKGSFDIANLRQELITELRARSEGGKALEPSQQVKTSERNACEGKTTRELPRESVSPSLQVDLLANSSFLWNSLRAKNILENSRVSVNDDVDTDEQYDDVIPLNCNNQEEYYDDVGMRVDKNSFNESLNEDDIYDDVMSPNCTEKNVSAVNEIHQNETKEEDDASISNDYSSVDEDSDHTLDNDQDLYDDVGLPSEERVNSLYAGSTASSILGSTWMNNSKESEWEDLEEIGQTCLANKSNSSETQSSKKRSGHRWPKKTRRRSKVLRKSLRSKSRPNLHETTLDDNASDDSTYESLHSFPADEFSTDSETEKVEEAKDQGSIETEQKTPKDWTNVSMEAPTRPNPPPPREVSLSRTLGRRIKMLRRTWSITKGSLGRMRRRTSVEDDHPCEENKEFVDGGKYFGFARHFKKNVSGSFSTFYLNGYTGNDPVTTRNDCNDSGKDTIYSDTREELDHYSVLVDQEPLYQFYAAAAARVAFDSNSDAYEDIEGISPSRTTTDLAKPGHRTLWCHTPQVINNGLLQRLNTDEKKIQEAKFEILTSEASYLNSLRVLKNEFLNEPSLDEILTPTEKDKLFGSIPSVLQASEQFLAELETIWNHDPMLHGLPDVLLKYTDKCLDIYVAYCSNQVSIDATFKDLRTRKGSKFVEIISQIEARSTCQNLSLHSFLMLPMQRITRLPLLADAVLSKLLVEDSDRPNWVKVLSSLNYVVTECNEGARAAAKEMEMENLARKLEYSVKIKPITLKGKYLVKSGSVVQLSSKSDTEYKLTFGKRFNKTPLYLLLLTDYLLVAKYKSNTHDETYTVIDTCKRSLIALESASDDSPFAGRNAMLLTLLENYSGHQVEYILTCESDTERQRWLEAVSPTKRGLVGETLYEVWDCPQVVALYCYSPNQPDELTLHPGDVINVFRKMSDGWYQGEKLLNSEQGWFPGNYTKEVASEHVRAKNLRQRHRFLTVSENVSQRKTKQQSTVH